jgi:hypothetical protein
MVGYRKRRYNEAVHAWRVLAGRIAAFVVAIALIVPVPVMPAGTMRHEDMSEISAASEQGPADLFSHALACHMDFEHHQLVRSENAFVIPAHVSIRVCYLTDVNSLSSREPAPLYRPPRA